jgi:hypothetical protein
MRTVVVNFSKILEDVTGISGWVEVDGPDTRCGVDYWFEGPDGQSAYINIDQGAMTVSIDGEVVFETDDYETDCPAEVHYEVG